MLSLAAPPDLGSKRTYSVPSDGLRPELRSGPLRSSRRYQKGVPSAAAPIEISSPAPSAASPTRRRPGSAETSRAEIRSAQRTGEVCRRMQRDHRPPDTTFRSSLLDQVGDHLDQTAAQQGQGKKERSIRERCGVPLPVMRETLAGNCLPASRHAARDVPCRPSADKSQRVDD